MTYNNQEVIKILSIDGGGVRGIIPCIFLSHLRKQLDIHGNHTPFHQIFDIMSGTSTGSLISLSLVKPPAELTDKERLDTLTHMYTQDTKLIFPSSKWDSWRYIKQLFRPKYNGKALKSLLRQTLKNYTLEEALTKLIVPAYDMHAMESYLFRKGNLRTSSHNFYLRDIGLASSSAPTYLPAARVKSLTDHQSYCFVDGGIFCNDPALCVYSFAKKTFPKAKKFLIVSLGTGKHTMSYQCKEVRKWGALGWMNPLQHTPLLAAYMDSQIESKDFILHNMSDVRVYRFQVSLDDITSAMDDSSDHNIDLLKQKAGALIMSNKRDIEHLVRQLSAISPIDHQLSSHPPRASSY